MTRGIPKPASTTPVDTNEVDVGQKTYVDMPGTGILDRSALHEDGIEIVPVAGLSEYAKELAFMEELVEVEVHESTDKNAEPIVDLYCNGIPQRFLRGRPVTVKRKYVQILADARQVAIATQTKVDGDDVINRINKHTALRYPFRVVRDDNPRGRDWLRSVLQAA